MSDANNMPVWLIVQRSAMDRRLDLYGRLDRRNLEWERDPRKATHFACPASAAAVMDGDGVVERHEVGEWPGGVSPEDAMLRGRVQALANPAWYDADTGEEVAS